MSDDRLWEDAGSVFRPSYSATWLNCSGSLIPSQLAIDTAGRDAAVGTVFHSLMAEWLQTGKRPDHRRGTTTEVGEHKIEFDDEMFEHGQLCVEFADNFQGVRHVELSVDISDLTPLDGQRGSLDFAALTEGRLVIVDWKYGRGVRVFAEQNTQLLLYAWGVFRRFDHVFKFQSIEMRIVQPRLRHWDVWIISRQELIDFSIFARERAALAWKRGADRTPSPKACQWCRVRVDCAALEFARQSLADQSFEAIDEPVTSEKMATVPDRIRGTTAVCSSVEQLSTESLARIYGWRKLMESWFADIGEELVRRELDGEQVPGWKVVEGRTKRHWRDEQLAAEKLTSVGLDEDAIYQRRLVSPAQAERLLKPAGITGRLLTKFVGLLVTRPPGRPTLAPDDDNRLALPNLADESFAEDADTELTI